MKYYFIVGETSGDQHAADVIRRLRTMDPQADIRGMGGDRCAREGMQLFQHYRSVSFMGFWEVLRHLGAIRRTMNAVRRDIASFAPDRLVLVDYPGFNLRMARFAKERRIPVHYYIAPKVWAWKESRLKKIRKYVDALYCILPFEEAYFRKHGIQARYIGNPSRQQIEAFQEQHAAPQREKTVVALLPGSRKQEIEANLPIMLRAMEAFPDYRPMIAQAPGFEDSYYHHFAPDTPLEKNMYALLDQSCGAIVTSGTATLETALLGVPQVVCYRTSWLTYQIAKRFIRIPYISLVNIILNRPALSELIQHDFNVDRIAEQLAPLMAQPDLLEEDYQRLKELLGTQDPANLLAQSLIA